MKPTKYCLKKWGGGKKLKECNRGGRFDQNTLYASMELSQLNHFVQLMYANRKRRYGCHGEKKEIVF
jgi:hypothetical protein